MLEAQKRANARNTLVPVHYRGYTTIVEPNHPPFSQDDLQSRLKDVLKAVLAKNMSKPNKISISSDDQDDEDMDEINELSQSILKPTRSQVKIKQFNNSK